MFKCLHLRDVNLFVLIGGHNFNGFFDMSESALTQNIKFIQSDIFCHMHIELGSGKSFWGEMGGRVIINGQLRNQHTACMNAKIIRIALHITAEMINTPRNFIGNMNGITKNGFAIIFNHGINFIFRQSECFGNLANKRATFKRGIGGQQGSVFGAVTFKNIACYIIAVFPRKIQIEIGWCFSE